MRTSLSAGAAMVVAHALTAVAAAAQPPPPPSIEPATSALRPATWARSLTNRLGMEMDVWVTHLSEDGRRASFFTTAWTPVAQLRVVEGLHVVAEVPLALGLVNGSTPQHDHTGGTFTVGNPTLGAYHGSLADERLALYIGGTVSVPTIHDHTEGDDEREVPVRQALLMRAFADSHRWIPNFLPLRLVAGAEVRLLANLYARFDVAPAFHVPMYEHPEIEAVIDQVNEIEYRADMGLGGGLRFQETLFPTTNFDDHVQTAAEVYGTYEPSEDGVYARLGLLVALDESYEEDELGSGFGFEEGKVATFKVAVGGKW